MEANFIIKDVNLISHENAEDELQIQTLDNGTMYETTIKIDPNNPKVVDVYSEWGYIVECLDDLNECKNRVGLLVEEAINYLMSCKNTIITGKEEL